MLKSIAAQLRALTQEAPVNVKIGCLLGYSESTCNKMVEHFAEDAIAIAVQAYEHDMPEAAMLRALGFAAR